MVLSGVKESEVEAMDQTEKLIIDIIDQHRDEIIEFASAARNFTECAEVADYAKCGNILQQLPENLKKQCLLNNKISEHTATDRNLFMAPPLEFAASPNL